MINEELVLKALSTVQEPDLKDDLVSLKMIEDLKVSSDQVSFTLVLTTPACPLKEQMKSDCIDAIGKISDGQIRVDINFTSRVFGRERENILPGVSHVVLVSSGKGGVGKSTVAVNLAISLQKTGASVGILDADVYGPSLPTMFELAGTRPGMKESNGKQMIMPIEKYGIKCMSIGLLIDEAQAVIWRGPMASSAIRQFFTDVDWGKLDYLVVDLPPGTGDIHLTVAQLLKSAAAVLVTTPQKVAVDDARKGASMFSTPGVDIPILGVIENMSYFTPDKGDTRYFIFGKGGGRQLASETDSELIAELPMTEEVADLSDRGRPISLDDKSHLSSIFSELAGKVAQKLSLHQAEKMKVQSLEN